MHEKALKALDQVRRKVGKEALPITESMYLVRAYLTTFCIGGVKLLGSVNIGRWGGYRSRS
jgi:hypothetical protein